MVGQCLLPNRNWTEAHATSRKSDFLTALGPTRASRDDSALAAHSQLTGDVGEAMSLAILCHRQIW